MCLWASSACFILSAVLFFEVASSASISRLWARLMISSFCSIFSFSLFLNSYKVMWPLYVIIKASTVTSIIIIVQNKINNRDVILQTSFYWKFSWVTFSCLLFWLSSFLFKFSCSWKRTTLTWIYNCSPAHFIWPFLPSKGCTLLSRCLSSQI